MQIQIKGLTSFMTYDQAGNCIFLKDVVSTGVYKLRVTITDENDSSSKEYTIELAIEEPPPVVVKQFVKKVEIVVKKEAPVQF